MILETYNSKKSEHTLEDTLNFLQELSEQQDEFIQCSEPDYEYKPIGFKVIDNAREIAKTLEFQPTHIFVTYRRSLQFEYNFQDSNNAYFEIEIYDDKISTLESFAKSYEKAKEYNFTMDNLKDLSIIVKNFMDKVRFVFNTSTLETTVYYKLNDSSYLAIDKNNTYTHIIFDANSNTYNIHISAISDFDTEDSKKMFLSLINKITEKEQANIISSEEFYKKILTYPIASINRDRLELSLY